MSVAVFSMAMVLINLLSVAVDLVVYPGTSWQLERGTCRLVIENNYTKLCLANGIHRRP